MIIVKREDGQVKPFSLDRIEKVLRWAAKEQGAHLITKEVLKEVEKNIFDGITKYELAEALILSVSAFIERDPAYGYIASRLIVKKLFKKVTKKPFDEKTFEALYRKSFIDSIQNGLEWELFDTRFADFDLNVLAGTLVLERDCDIDYMGMKTLYERYFMKHEENYMELPQVFFMRVAMGLCIEEENKTERAIEFYNLMSQRNYMPSTPTLLHSGLVRAQLSSCFLSSVDDDLHHIFKCLGDDAQLSKWSGGVANDWTNVRATGSQIKSIRIESQGVIPFLKLVNDIVVAINRSGRRRGAICVYLETWHLDIEDFLDLRRNTGDERRRTHDINTVNWVPDLFMKRVAAGSIWTLFSSQEVPDLHELYGKAFEKRYQEYEKLAAEGKVKQFKTIQAKDLWRKMLTRLFETGHPWLTFKDPCNVRSPQDHAGVVRCSNLCTEITLNTSAEETAVCNLGSVNLANHIVDGKLDKECLAKTVKTAIRMLDNVININFYPTKEAKTANFRHRPIGLGQMGFQDALYKQNINFSDKKALEFADEVAELISYHAILTSSELAKERGAYSSFEGSKWDRNIFPLDTVDLLEEERGMKINVSRESKLDWTPVRDHVQKYGMRNSNTMAIAPTATISNISGCFPCIEPIFKNLYVKSNMSGEFTVVNKYLINDLKERGIWNKQTLDELKYYDGNVQAIPTIPQDIKDKYKEAFELDPKWLLEITAARGKWIDQSQSHNLFIKGVSGKLLSDVYMHAWNLGLKTTYYCRTLGATQVEKSTLDASKYGYTQKRTYEALEDKNSEQAQACSILNGPDCESCQ